MPVKLHHSSLYNFYFLPAWISNELTALAFEIPVLEFMAKSLLRPRSCASHSSVLDVCRLSL